MAIGEICCRDLVFVSREDTVTLAAQLMRQRHVGSLIVVDDRAGRSIPAGIITDRDIVVAVVALGLDPDVIPVGDIMGRELFCVRNDAGIAETAELMRLKGVRRLPVIDNAGELVGVVASDELMSLLADEMSALATMVSRAPRDETETRKRMS